jgi:hypothetical protein
MSKLRQDYEGRRGPPSRNSPHSSQPEKGALTLVVPIVRYASVALERVLVIVGRAFVVVGRVVGYTLLIVAVFAVSMALGAGIAVALEYLVGWPNTW